MKKIQRNDKGYSLVELMAVLAIMAILAASSTPVFTGYLKKAKTSEHLVNCRAIQMAADTCLLDVTERRSRTPDLMELEEEIEAFTGLDVEILEDSEAALREPYGVIMVESATGEWICETILCEIDGNLWSYRAEDGKLNEMEK